MHRGLSVIVSNTPGAGRLAVVAALATLVGCSESLVEPNTMENLPPDGMAVTRTLASFQGSAIPFEPTLESRPLSAAPSMAAATTDCVFDENARKKTMKLLADCTTDGTIFIPDGWKLDGRRHTITAVDPVGDHFRGAVVQNAGSRASVRNLTVTASGLANVCDAGADRLRGIMFEGASGKIEHNQVFGINQGASGCQEGNAIEVRNAPFDGTHPNPQRVEVKHNRIGSYQKTGIVVNGDVVAKVERNRLGASATQANLAANGIQLGFGATGKVKHNDLDGNQWLGASDYGASGILIYAADDVEVKENKVRGNSDVGIWALGDNGRYHRNRAVDEGVDGPHGDFGIADQGAGNRFDYNRVCGFDTPFFPDPLPGRRNRACRVVTPPGGEE